MTPQLSGVEYWECGLPWKPQHFIRVAFGEREFVAPCSDVAIYRRWSSRRVRRTAARVQPGLFAGRGRHPKQPTVALAWSAK